MTLIVEDGTGVAGAESYASVSGADAYWLLWGWNSGWTAETVDNKESALRLATRWLDLNYDYCEELLDIDQALGYPRTLCYDRQGRAIGGEGILPANLVAACIEAADMFRKNGYANPDTSAIIKEKIGQSDFTYSASKMADMDVNRVTNILRGIATPAGNVFKLRRG